MSSFSQDKKFIESVIQGDLLESAIAWIGENIDPEDVFDDDKLIKWAEENGYVKDTGDRPERPLSASGFTPPMSDRRASTEGIWLHLLTRLTVARKARYGSLCIISGA